MPDASTLLSEKVRSRHLATSSMRKYPATIDVLRNVDLYVRNDGGAPLKVVDVPEGVNALQTAEGEEFAQGAALIAAHRTPFG